MQKYEDIINDDITTLNVKITAKFKKRLENEAIKRDLLVDEFLLSAIAIGYNKVVSDIK